MKKKKQEQQINYLDLIPVKAEGLKWHKDFRDRVILEVKNEGFFNGIAQKVFNRPEVTKIHLDVHGSYLWPFIDGERTVMDLAALEKERFGLLEEVKTVNIGNEMAVTLSIGIGMNGDTYSQKIGRAHV